MLNPMQLVQLMRIGAPKSAVIDIVKRGAGNNPIMNNAVTMLENNDTQGIEMLCRNLCKEKGMDADVMIEQIKRQYGLN